MSDGLTSIEDLKVVISAETESLGKGLENAQSLISRFATDAEGKLGLFDVAVSKSGAGLQALRGALGVWASAATMALDVLEKISEKGDVAFKKLGADEEWKKLKSSVSDLVPALQEGATGAFTTATKAALAYGAAMSGVDLATDKAASSTKEFANEKLAAATEMMNRAGHEMRRLAPQETWKVGTVDSELARTRREIDGIVQRIEQFQKSNSPSFMDTLIGGLIPGNQHLLALDGLQAKLAALQAQLEALGGLRVQKQWGVLEVDKGTAELMQPIEREIASLKIRAATLQMTAAEAAAFTAAERVRAEAVKSGDAALAAANVELARRLPLMVALRQQIQAHTDAEKYAEKQEKGEKALMEGLDRELMGLQQKQRALTDNSAATKAQEIEERTLAQARQRNIEVTDAMAIQIKAYANGIARADEALKGHQQMLNQMNQVGNVVFKGLETGLDRLVSGGKLNIKDLVDSTLRDLNRLLLRMMVIQPLQQALIGGGGSAGALGSLFGGFRAEGGPVDAGRAYVVGERGEEWFVPREAGTIVSNDSLRRAAGGGDGGESRGNTTVTVINNHPGVRVETEEAVDGRGNRSTQVMIEETVARSLASPSGQAAMRGYGNRPVLTNR